MTKIEELEQKIETINIVLENLKLELENYEKELAELKESKKEGKWKPEIGEKYWFRNTNSIIGYEHFYLDSCHKWRVENLPVFKTKSECARYWHFMDTVKEKSYEFTTDEWRNWDIEKYDILYDFVGKCLKVTVVRTNKYLGEIYFRTREDAQYIIDNFKDELMEYWI